MSNSKRIQKKVKQLSSRKYGMHYWFRIRTENLNKTVKGAIVACKKLAAAFDEITNTMNDLKVKNGKL